MTTRIFDSHFHIGAYGTQLFEQHRIHPIPDTLDHCTGDDCLQYLQGHDLWGGLIVPTYLEDQAAAFRYNQLLLDAVTKHPRLFGGLWVSPLAEVESLCDAALGLLPHPKIRALKMASNTWKPCGIHPRTWTARVRRNMEKILEAARHHALIIHLHTGYIDGATPLAFEGFMREYGKAATYQFVHMGEAIAPIFAFVPRFIDWIQQSYSVYTDTSLAPGFAPPWLLAELDRYNLGFSRVLFATDAPWGRFPTEYQKVASTDINDAIQEQLFWKNAAALYNLES